MEHPYIIMLGTAATKPTRSRINSSALLKIGATNILIDSGEGAQQALLVHANLGANALHGMILTHFHADHYLGLASLLKSRNGFDIPPLNIHCNAADEWLIARYLEATFTSPELYRLIPVTYGKPFQLSKEWAVTAFCAAHRVTAMSLLLTETDQPPVLDAARAMRDGAENGPMMGKLARGESVTVSSGAVLNGADYLSDPRPGRRVIFTGDTRPTGTLAQLSRGADTIICDTTYLDSDHDHALKCAHTTAREAGYLAKTAGARRLVMTHFSTRYKTETNRGTEMQKAEAEHAAGESVTVVAPEDGSYIYF